MSVKCLAECLIHSKYQYELAEIINWQGRERDLQDGNLQGIEDAKQRHKAQET